MWFFYHGRQSGPKTLKFALFRAAVTAAGIAGFLHNHAGKAGELRLKVLPDPAGQVLRGGIFQTINVVKQVVIKLLKERLEGLFQICKVHDPSGFGTEFTAHMNLDTKGVAMHATAFMPLRNPGQEMGRFNLKNTKYIHAAIVRTGAPVRKH